MCGICGYLGSGDQGLLNRMCSALRHRGPDDMGFFLDNDQRVGLGHTRLSIIDLEGGHQPLSNEDESIWITYNGEIYNYRELKHDLVAKGHSFRTNSDTEVIVHLYEDYGRDCLRFLNGMFAFALWDRRNRQLFLARDRLGVKPLIFAEIGNGFFFASEHKALIQAIPNPTLDHQTIADYLTFSFIPAPATVYTEMRKLPPGCMMTVSSSGVNVEKYWRVISSGFCTARGCEEETILNLLESAVTSRMVSDVPVGSYLSGGVDSTCIATLMRNHVCNADINTFSLGYDESLVGKEEDRRYAHLMSRRLHTNHHEYILSPREFWDDLPAVAECFDEPHSGVVSSFFLTKLVRNHVKVALAGDGGDELFAGYSMNQFPRYFSWYNQLPGVLRKALIPYAANVLERMSPLFSPLRIPSRFLHFASGDEADWRLNFLIFTDKEKRSLIGEALKSPDILPARRLMESWFSECTEPDDPITRSLEVEINHILPDGELYFVDRLSMAHAVEVRVPFLDYRLVEYAFTLPSSLKLHHGKGKYIFRKALQNLIPQDIIKRKKEGFNTPYDHFFRALEDEVRSFFKDALVFSQGLLNRHGVDTLLDGFYLKSQVPASKLFCVVMLEHWARMTRTC